MTRKEALTNGVCIRCKQPPTFYSMAGRAEYPITGLCEPCFDLVTGAEETGEEIMRHEEMTDAQYDFETIASSQAYKDAAILGFEVVLPQDNQLQIDIDDEAAYLVYLGNLKRYKLHFDNNPVILEETKPSKSGKEGHRHITLTLADPVSNEMRIMLQALLGSDPVRELLSYIRLVNDDEHPTLFIEKPAQKLLSGITEEALLAAGTPEEDQGITHFYREDFVEPADEGAY
jgi:hypothetical protein